MLNRVFVFVVFVGKVQQLLRYWHLPQTQLKG